MEQENKKPTITPTPEAFFFAGGTEYLPVTILAISREAAEAEWKKTRQPTQSTTKTEPEIISSKK